MLLDGVNLIEFNTVQLQYLGPFGGKPLLIRKDCFRMQFRE